MAFGHLRAVLALDVDRSSAHDATEDCRLWRQRISAAVAVPSLRRTPAEHVARGWSLRWSPLWSEVGFDFLLSRRFPENVSSCGEVVLVTSESSAEAKARRNRGALTEWIGGCGWLGRWLWCCRRADGAVGFRVVAFLMMTVFPLPVLASRCNARRRSVVS